MEKLISYRKLSDKLKLLGKCGNSYIQRSVPYLLNMIYEMEDDRGRGHWIVHSYKDEEPYDCTWWAYNECSVCHKKLIDKYDYCPFCGSKMDEEI